MAEVFLKFDTVLSGPSGRSYESRVCGRVMDDVGRWEGWIEFVPDDGSAVLHTSRETVQPNRQDLEYWATGLTTAYLEGALERALKPSPTLPGPTESPQPTYDQPAPAEERASTRPAPFGRPEPLLDPFHVYKQGEELLRQELAALNPSHLRNIVRAYGLVEEEGIDLMRMSRADLTDLIATAVRSRVR